MSIFSSFDDKLYSHTGISKDLSTDVHLLTDPMNNKHQVRDVLVLISIGGESFVTSKHTSASSCKRSESSIEGKKFS